VIRNVVGPKYGDGSRDGKTEASRTHHPQSGRLVIGSQEGPAPATLDRDVTLIATGSGECP
jgi:hypothetical protein